MDVERKNLTIIIPLYNEEDNLAELQRRVGNVIKKLGFKNNEVLLISDGSTDQTERIITAMVDKDSLFRGIFLTRNFGHQAAV